MAKINYHALQLLRDHAAISAAVTVDAGTLVSLINEVLEHRDPPPISEVNHEHTSAANGASEGGDRPSGHEVMCERLAKVEDRLADINRTISQLDASWSRTQADNGRRLSAIEWKIT